MPVNTSRRPLLNPKFLLNQTPENYDLPIWKENPLKAASNYSTHKTKFAIAGFYFTSIVVLYWVSFISWVFWNLSALIFAKDQSIYGVITTLMIVGVALTFTVGVTGIIFSHIGYYLSKKYGFMGKFYAIWGLMLGYVPPLFFMLLFVAISNLIGL